LENDRSRNRVMYREWPWLCPLFPKAVIRLLILPTAANDALPTSACSVMLRSDCPLLLTRVLAKIANPLFE